MRHITFVYIAMLMIAIVGCSSTDTPTPDFTLSAMVQGNWLVETMDASKDWATLGTLTIDRNSYHFSSAHEAETLSDMQDQLCFLKRPAGKLVFEYLPKVSPDDDIRSLVDNDILLKIDIGCGETFLIRADQGGKELYWHSEFSEVQFYRIHKSYSD
jgi:hypothetical protein